MSFKGTKRIVYACLGLQVVQTYFPLIAILQVCSTWWLISLKTLPLFFVGLFLHMFSHSSWEHFFGNMSVGIPAMMYLEYRLGRKEMFRCFIYSGLAAMICQAFVIQGPGGMIGASGAIFGCLSADCILLCETRAGRMLGLPLLGMWLIPQLISLSMGADGIAYSAHIGGAVAGIAYVALWYLPSLPEEPAHKAPEADESETEDWY